jgi:hypothetical protein
MNPTCPWPRRMIRPLVLALMLAGAPAMAAATNAETVPPFCGIYWGSLAKSSTGMGADYITNVRTGRHTCYDRLVIDGSAGGFTSRVRYVANVLSQGKGDSVSLRGGARIEIVLRTNDYNINTGVATYTPANWRELTNVTGYSTFGQVAWGGSFEGYTTIGLGVRARLPMRVFNLAGPGGRSRLVIDVAHHW